MSQKTVEAKGFVCNPPKETEENTLALCRHMDMAGTAFGLPTQNYTLTLGRSGGVRGISADFSRDVSTTDYFEVRRQIEDFFPDKYDPGTIHAQGSVRRDEWRAPDGSAAVLLLSNGVPPITRTKLMISFWRETTAVQAAKPTRKK